MRKYSGYLAAALLVVVGLALLATGLRRPVTVLVDGEPLVVETYAWNTASVLRDAGLTVRAEDRITPALEAGLGWNAAILVERARQVFVSGSTEGSPPSLVTPERIPGNILIQLGVRLFPGDEILLNGAPVAPEKRLSLDQSVSLQLRAARPVTIVENGAPRTVYTTGSTLGAALWDSGLPISPVDDLSADFNAGLDQASAVAVKRAAVVRVSVDGREVDGESASATVGQALVDLGISLQGLDRSVPAEDQPLPADGRVRVIRVREEIVLKQTTIAFKNELVADPNLELDSTRIAEVGQPGIRVTRERVRFEDGKEIRRQAEAEWLASQPKNQKLAYGTRVVIRTLDTPDGPVEYWRKVTVYATSMAPCKFIPYIGRCSYQVANGMKLQKGVIGVGETWYRLLANQRVYVDRYGPGVIADWGYVPGFWLDLGFSDDDYVAWHYNTTLYFLTPIPANIPWILPR